VADGWRASNTAFTIAGMLAVVSGLGLLSSRETVAAADRAVPSPSSETVVTVDHIILRHFEVGEDDVVAEALHFRGIALFTFGVFLISGILQFRTPLQ